MRIALDQHLTTVCNHLLCCPVVLSLFCCSRTLTSTHNHMYCLSLLKCYTSLNQVCTGLWLVCTWFLKVAVTCINGKKYPFYKILLLRTYKSNQLIRRITLQSIKYTLNVPSITAMHSSNTQPKRFISVHA